MAISKTKKKKERKKINDDMTLMWFNWSVATINVMLQLLDIYIYIYIYVESWFVAQTQSIWDLNPVSPIQ